MSGENNNTAETVDEQTVAGNIITIHTTLGDEDEDVHKCGRCQVEFTSLEAFIQHKLQNNCQRIQEVPGSQGPNEELHRSSQEVILSEGVSVTTILVDDSAASSEEADRARNTDEAGEMGTAHGGRRRRGSAARGSPTTQGSDSGQESRSEVNKAAYRLNSDGRFVCPLCEKTFKTANILRAHLTTHSEKKSFLCKLCGNAFRTKGSLIRHNRRHTDERPYRCNLCGLCFRESGALTRHLKSITPCTEKIRFSQCKEILVNKDGVQKELPTALSPPGTPTEAQVSVVTVVPGSEEDILQEVHVQMEVDSSEEVQQQMESAAEEEHQVEEHTEGDNLISQAIINSGIALEGDREEDEGEDEGKEPELPLPAHDTENRIAEIQVREECVEVDSEDITEPLERHGEEKGHKCPHCNRVFKAPNYLRIHVKGHLGYKPFRCVVCQKDFLTGYLLKKHMEAHLSERRFKCGECGKLYKTIGHVREHMRAHSDDRPYRCNKCDKGYKTKNALQVHQRTHGEERPYVCQFCSRGFREKGSLVRHIRHHTGEKPFKCYKCDRGFAEHGTLNRHLRAKGGCFGGLKDGEQAEETEDQASADSVAATIISEDPHAVLVEFSSVVADTQEYIIEAPSETAESGGEVALMQDDRNEVGSHIMKVVQQIVNQSHAGHQIIVQNVTMDEAAALSSDCGDTITIATPESLTEQVAMTLASAISDGTILTTEGGLETGDGTVTMVAARDIEVMEQAEEFVITSPEEVEIQTVIVQD
ncbi:transcription factor E4F1 isoform X2 [Amia ocellicauda]|uniref:transcription factor E4F1 isoform X2 n=1 Tax=Amia ocellicauda TaxID=2972642 RepID=UPI0034649A4C